MPRMTKDQIKSAVLEQIADSEGYDTDELAAMRKDALDYYYNRESIAPSMDGRSKLQSSDVADMVEAVTAQIMPAFDGDAIVEVEPVTEQDIEQARTETSAVNWCVMEQNRGQYEIQQALRDALLLRNGIIKVYLDENEKVDVEYKEGLTELEFGQLMGQDVGDISRTDNGIAVQEMGERKDGFHDVRVTIKTTERKVCVQAVDPANFMWERDHDSIYLDRIRFCAERFLPTRSELLQMGYNKKKVNSLNAGGNDTRIDNLARNQNSARRHWEGVTPAEDIIEAFECFIRLDADGDGIAELLRVVIGAEEILDVYEVDFIPYAAGTPFLQPHRFTGMGLFDKLKNVQDQKTFGIRQWADNVNNTNYSRFVVMDGAANLDDLTNARPGGVIRASSPDAVTPLMVNDIGSSVGTFLEYADKMRSERGGAALDMQTAEMQIAGDTAHGVERQMSSKELLCAMMTRTLAHTLIKSTYELVHMALRLYVPDNLQFRTGSEFAQVSPQDWMERKHFGVKSGLSPAERARKQAALATVVQQQMGLMQSGMDGVLVDPMSVYNAMMDWMRCGGLDMPENYFVDPNSQQAQQAQQGKAEQAQQEQQYQAMLLELQKQIEARKADNADAKVMEDGRQFDAELSFKYDELAQEAAYKEAEMSVNLAGSMSAENGSEDDTGRETVQ